MVGSPPRSPKSRQAARPASPPRREQLTTVASRLSTPIYISDRAVPNEHNTVQLFEVRDATQSISEQKDMHKYDTEYVPLQKWLRVPRSLQQQQPPRLDNNWNDPDFPAADSSITRNPQIAAPPGITWRRVTGDLYRRPRHYFTVQQGPLSASWFAGALAAVATREELLLDLIASDEYAQNGCFVFQFFKHGAWHRVAVDTCLPATTAAAAGVEAAAEEGSRAEVLAGLSLAGSQGLWAPLLEKAYAKLHGGYHALTAAAARRPQSADAHSAAANMDELLHPDEGPAAAAGQQQGYAAAAAAGAGLNPQVPVVPGPWSLREALMDLTGGTVTKMRLDSEQLGAEVASGGTWHRCTSTLANGGLVVCSCKSGAADDGAQATGGILFNRCYSVVATLTLPAGPQRPQPVKLLRLQCPWGAQGLWQGPWSQGAEEWGPAGEVGTVAAAVGAMQQAGGDSTRGAGQWGLESDPTTCWINYWDFIQVFNRVWLVDLPPGDHHQLTVQCGWVAASAGGPPYLAPSPGTSAAAGPAGVQQLVQQAKPEHRAAADEQAAASSRQPPDLASSLLVSSSSSSQRLSSTWCCNPQFCLSVSGAGQVTVTLSLQDSKLAGGCHTPKRFRSLAAGLTVLHLPPGTPTNPPPRAWTPGSTRSAYSTLAGGSRVSTAASSASTAGAGGAAGNPLAPRRKELRVVASLPLSTARDTTVSFYAAAASQGGTYLLVPHAVDPGLAAPFVLRVQSSSPMQLQQLPSPLSLVIGGAWEGPSAGGSCSCATWGCNPQYLVSCPRQTHVIISVSRPDVIDSLLPPAFDQSECVGMTLVQPQATLGGLGHRGNVQVLAAQLRKKQAAAAAGKETAAAGTGTSSRPSSQQADAAAGPLFVAHGWQHMDEEQLQVVLPPDEPLLIVPSTHGPGVEAPFELRLLSDYPLELVPLPPVISVAHRGRWGPGNSGGSNLNRTWASNPRFLLQLSKKAACRLTLQREAGPWRRNQSLAAMIGCYVLRAQDAEGTLPAKDWPKALLHEMTFVPSEVLEEELVLPGGVPLLVVPATYEAGVHGGFVLQACCNMPLEFRPLVVAE